jgi:hypothetical protein
LRLCVTSPKVAGWIPDEVNEFLSIYVILLTALIYGVYSAFNGNEYEKQRNYVSGE